MNHRPPLFALLLVLTLACRAAVAQSPATQPEPKKVALLTNYYPVASHANAIGTKFLAGFPTDDGLVPVQVKVVSMYIDQPLSDEPDPANKGLWDLGKRLAKQFGVPIYPTVAGALTLGGDKLAVDAVLYVGEHGNYPPSRLGAKMYPRLRILEQVFSVFDASNKVVPVYDDKHLAYSWLDSKWIYDRAKELDVPMMAGSSLPMAWRDPVLVHPLGSKITEAVSIGYGGFDSYGFHALEILQCMVERRAGGETGVAGVQCLKGKALYEAAAAGRFSLPLAQAACDAIRDKRMDKPLPEADPEAIGILISYRDGTKGTMLMLNGRYIGEHWAYAAKMDGKVQACEFILDTAPAVAHFSYLSLNIQQMFLTGKPTTPLERTLLTSGVLDTALRSQHDGGKAMETPFLAVAYKADGYQTIVPKSPRPVAQGPEVWPPAGLEYILRPVTVKPAAKATTRPAQGQ